MSGIFALYLRVQCEVFHRDYDLAVTYLHLFSFRLAFNSLKKHEYFFLYFIIIIIIIDYYYLRGGQRDNSFRLN
jgi:hypothetical protein